MCVHVRVCVRVCMRVHVHVRVCMRVHVRVCVKNKENHPDRFIQVFKQKP